MFSLIAFTCSLTGGDCYHSVITQEIEHQMACMTRGQAQVAEWLGDRPERRLEQFICVESRDVERVLSQDGRI